MPRKRGFLKNIVKDPQVRVETVNGVAWAGKNHNPPNWRGDNALPTTGSTKGQFEPWQGDRSGE